MIDADACDEMIDVDAFCFGEGFTSQASLAARKPEQPQGRTLLFASCKRVADVSGNPLMCPFVANDQEGGEGDVTRF